MINNSFIVTFSGIDGSGKSQYIILLRRFLRRQGISYLYIHSVNDSLTNRLVRKFPKFKNIIGPKENEQNKKNLADSSNRPRKIKKISAFSSFIRFFILFLDALYLRLRMISYNKNYQVIIFDRYIYDKLVHIAYLRNKKILPFSYFWLKIFPKANLSFYLQVLPEDALERKPEMKMEGQDIKYLNKKYQLFEEGKMIWKLREIRTSGTSISEAKKKIISLFKKRFFRFLKIKKSHD